MRLRFSENGPNETSNPCLKKLEAFYYLRGTKSNPKVYCWPTSLRRGF